MECRARQHRRARPDRQGCPPRAGSAWCLGRPGPAWARPAWCLGPSAGPAGAAGGLSGTSLRQRRRLQPARCDVVVAAVCAGEGRCGSGAASSPPAATSLWQRCSCQPARRDIVVAAVPPSACPGRPPGAIVRQRRSGGQWALGRAGAARRAPTTLRARAAAGEPRVSRRCRVCTWRPCQCAGRPGSRSPGRSSR
jgi:hypothetical protein